MTSYFLCRECSSLVLTEAKEKHYTCCNGTYHMKIGRYDFTEPKFLVLRNVDFKLAQ